MIHRLKEAQQDAARLDNGVDVGRQLLTFLVVGALSTLLFFAAYNVLRLIGAPPLVANALSLLFSTIFSFLANRRYTFSVTGWRHALRQFIEFSSLLVLTLVMSSGALTVLFALHPSAGRLEENVVLLGASGILTLIRFWLLRTWVFRSAR